MPLPGIRRQAVDRARGPRAARWRRSQRCPRRERPHQRVRCSSTSARRRYTPLVPPGRDAARPRKFFQICMPGPVHRRLRGQLDRDAGGSQQDCVAADDDQQDRISASAHRWRRHLASWRPRRRRVAQASASGYDATWDAWLRMPAHHQNVPPAAAIATALSPRFAPSHTGRSARPAARRFWPAAEPSPAALPPRRLVDAGRLASLRDRHSTPPPPLLGAPLPPRTNSISGGASARRQSAGCPARSRDVALSSSQRAMARRTKRGPSAQRRTATSARRERRWRAAPRAQ